jgi:curved DNA-binding protein CbpA
MQQWKDYYEMLGVNPEADQEEIKKAYRELAHGFHPDKNPNSTEQMRKLADEKMKEINEAHDTLGDPEKRKKYHSEWIVKKSPPKPVVDPSYILFDNVSAKTVKIGSFIIRNAGGTYSEIWFLNPRQINPKSWVQVTKYYSLTEYGKLPLKVEISAEGTDWGKTYSEIIPVRLDNEKTQVRIELRTQTEPAGKTTYAGAGSDPWGYGSRTGTVAPSAPAQAGSRPKMPVLAKWIVGVLFIIVAITAWRNIASNSYPTRQSPSANGSPSSQPDVTDTKNISNFSGKWEGNYIDKDVQGREYQMGFKLDLMQNGAQITGITTEKRDYRTLTAQIDGTVKGRTIRFVKQYNEEPRRALPIQYEGSITADGGSVIGTWRTSISSGKWSISRTSKNPLPKSYDTMLFQPSSQASTIPQPTEKITIDSLTKNIPDTNYFVAKSKIFDASFDIVWSAASEYLKKDHVIDISDYNKGILTTKQMTQSVGRSKEAYRTFILIEKISEDSTKVTVKRFSYNYFQNEWYQPWGRSFGEIDLVGIEKKIKGEIKNDSRKN